MCPYQMLGRLPTHPKSGSYMLLIALSPPSPLALAPLCLVSLSWKGALLGETSDVCEGLGWQPNQLPPQSSRPKTIGRVPHWSGHPPSCSSALSAKPSGNPTGRVTKAR